jgi:release factor glutamine methyltransferase
MADWHPLPTEDLIPSQSFQELNSQAEAIAKACPPAEMPSIDHLKMADYNLVYEPSDDTFLMLDALSYEFKDQPEKLSKISNVLEIGCGTAVSTIYLGKLLQDAGNMSAKLHVTDINKDAIRIAKETAYKNGMIDSSFITHRCDLATPLMDEMDGKIDVLIFNPPYVPTPADEVGSEGIEASWAGGKDGRVVFDRAIPQISSLLSRPGGVAYIITVDDNKPEEIADILNHTYNIQVIPLLRRRARNEFLSVLKFQLK